MVLALFSLALGVGINIVTALAKPSESTRRVGLIAGWGLIGFAALIAIQSWSPIVFQWPLAWRDSGMRTTVAPTAQAASQRTISAQQQFDIAQKLLPGPINCLVTVIASEQNASYAERFCRSFKIAGWKMINEEDGDCVGAPIGFNVGSGITIKAKKDDPCGQTLESALLSQNIDVKVKTVGLPASSVQLDVGNQQQ